MRLGQIKPALLRANKLPFLGQACGLDWREVFREQRKVTAEHALLGCIHAPSSASILLPCHWFRSIYVILSDSPGFVT